MVASSRSVNEDSLRLFDGVGLQFYRVSLVRSMSKAGAIESLLRLRKHGMGYRIVLTSVVGVLLPLSRADLR